jgi:antitoxin (DNA-binding transcriptional repressor) of toxin-antitoxin stability system
MKSVGIKQLKAHLSEYVRMAKAGDTILVTERDEVVAELRPAHRRRPVSDLDEALDVLADAGEITRPGLRKESWTWCTKGLNLPAGTAEGLLDFVRGERGDE